MHMRTFADSYVNGGQDWGLTTPGCVTTAASTQSPINVADQIVTFGASLPPLNISYGKSASWMLEITGAYGASISSSSRLRCGQTEPALHSRNLASALRSELPGGG